MSTVVTKYTRSLLSAGIVETILGNSVTMEELSSFQGWLWAHLPLTATSDSVLVNVSVCLLLRYKGGFSDTVFLLLPSRPPPPSLSLPLPPPPSLSLSSLSLPPSLSPTLRAQRPNQNQLLARVVRARRKLLSAPALALSRRRRKSQRLERHRLKATGRWGAFSHC